MKKKFHRDGRKFPSGWRKIITGMMKNDLQGSPKKHKTILTTSIS